MASAIYIYPNFAAYDNFYGANLKNIINHLPIIDLYINIAKEQLFVVTNTAGEGFRVDKSRGIVHIRQESLMENVITEDETLVLHDKIVYDKRKKQIQFFPSKLPGWLKKPKMVQKVDRYVTGDINKHRDQIDTTKMFYDFEYDRINMIMKDGL